MGDILLSVGLMVRIGVEDLLRVFGGEGLRERLVKICLENDIVFMAVFGSFARGEQGPESDVDVAIEFSKDSGKTLLDLVRIEDELTRVFGRKVDLGIFSSISPYMVEDVKREMVVIYEEG